MRISLVCALLISAVGISAAPATQPAAGGPSLATPILREGSYIINRIGRLTHASDGQQWQFVFDPGQSPDGDPSIFILPNLNLMLMENAVVSDNHGIHFKISGMVTEYRAHNYVLLQKVVVIPETGS